MKVSAFTICRNAVQFDSPIVEVIRSALPIVDEFIVNVGQSDDGTLDLIRSIGSDKIRVIESVWDDAMQTDGLLFSHETNIALSRCSGDWALYLQADKVLHETGYDTILRALRDDLADSTVLASLSATCTSTGTTGPAIPGSTIGRSGSSATTARSSPAAMRWGFGSSRIGDISRLSTRSGCDRRAPRSIITAG